MHDAENKPDALAIGYEIMDQSRELVKLLAIGIRADGSVLILDTGLTDEDANEMYGDFRLWLGGQLGRQITS